MASLENKSFYYAYLYSEAGGGFNEMDLVTANLELLQKFIVKMTQNSLYMALEYSIFLEVTKIEHGEIKEAEILPYQHTKLRIDGIDGEFIYRPKTGIFKAKLGKAQQNKLHALIEQEEQNPAMPPCMRLEVDWAAAGLVPLEGDLAQEGDSLEKPHRFGIFHPIVVGSSFESKTEAELKRWLQDTVV
jgi:hypothetical protein